MSVTAGQPATFTVAATGTAPITYQWQRGGVAISGATAASYTVGSTVIGDNGASFVVQVTNAVTTIASSAAVLTVVAPQVAPSFTSPPSDVTVTAPASASFAVVATGQPAPTLQWQLSVDNGVTWTNIVGATTATYTTPATTVGDSFRRFRAVATNTAGVINSPLATLIVNPAVLPDKLYLLAGNPGQRGSTDGAALTARFDDPVGVAVDSSRNVFVADWRNHTIRKITPAGVVSTLAGSPTLGGTADGTGSAARFYFPRGIAIDPTTGDVIVADQGNHLIRRVTQAGVVTTLAGLAGNIGTLKNDRLNFPNAVTVDGAGTIYVANTNDNTIGFITAGGSRGNIAGYPGRTGRTDGVDTLGTFWSPSDLVLDGLGNLFVVDRFNSAIRKVVLATHAVTTYAGQLQVGGFADGTGSAAQFANPSGITISAAGTLYVADNVNNIIRKITTGGVVTTVLGVLNSDPGFEFRTGPNPRLGRPLFMAMLDATHIVVSMETSNSGVYIAVVP